MDTLKKILEITLQNRNRYISVLQEIPKAQLLEIPDGFNNNIYWNVGHLLVVQQLLVYKLSHLEPTIHEEIIAKFRGGTFPQNVVEESEFTYIMDMLPQTIKQTQIDYDNGLFKEYQGFTTMSGATLKDAEDAMAFNLFHEGVHWGTILTLLKKVKNNA